MANKTDQGQVTTTITTSSSQAPHLLKIAAELRNEIYRLALTIEDIEVDASTFNIRKALVDTSSQLRAETREIFYAENKFSLTLDGLNVGASVKWLESLGKNALLITGLRLMLHPSDAWVNELRKTGLQSSWLESMAASQGNRDGRLVEKASRAAESMGLAGMQVTLYPGWERAGKECGTHLKRWYMSKF